MPIPKNFPLPCIREDTTGWVVQLNKSCAVPVKSLEEGLTWIESRPVTNKVYAQVPGTLRFELAKDSYDPDELLTSDLDD